MSTKSVAASAVQGSPDIHSEVQRRRSFAIISHPDAGKTTLTEKLLMFGGAIKSAGTVKGRKSSKHATSDWMEVEKQRGISVTSAAMQFEHDGCVINLLDTPGHQDFSEDTYRVLTAVDAALMVIDAAKGVESQTIKLLEVCRSRNTPVITFINKMDREVRPPLEVIDEIEEVLGVECSPVTWPLGMGKGFAGVYNIHDDQLVRFDPGQDHVHSESQIFEGIHNETLKAEYPIEHEAFLEEIELVNGAGTPFDLDRFLAGELSPVFFGSAINNYGVQDILKALVDWAPAPRPRAAETRTVHPDENRFSGIVFKIQANMDPQHRDRIAFVRICSGQYFDGIAMKHVLSGKKFRCSQAITFMAQDRSRLQTGFAGDIIGIQNHGRLKIGDVLTEGENLELGGIPYFSPELFRIPRLKDPLKTKQLKRALKELGEEGTIQVFERLEGGEVMLGAVGILQFETVAQRLESEFGVNATFEPVNIHKALWVTADTDNMLKKFEQANHRRLARDASGSLTFLAPTRQILELAKEKWPEVTFHTTREYRGLEAA